MSDSSPINAKLNLNVDLTKPAEDISDITKNIHKGLGKLIYALCGPWMEKRIGQAKRIAAQADQECIDILSGRKVFDENTGMTIPIKEVSSVDALCVELERVDAECKAKRLAAAIMKSATEIKQIPVEEISNEPLNQTFFNHWKEEAELIDDEDLRQLWAKLLVEETRRPNSVSPRTLSVVKNLSKSDADIFERLGLCIVGNNIVVNSQDHPLNGTYHDVLTLQDAGLIGQKSSCWYSPAANNTVFIPLSNQYCIIASNCNKKITFSCHILTQSVQSLQQTTNMQLGCQELS